MFFRFNLLLSLLVLISIPAFGQAKPDTISIASHNFKTGETSITSVSQTKKPSSGSSEIKLWGGSPSPQKGKFTPNDFTNHTWITNREALMTYPLSSIVKIWVTDSQGTATGSGMLIGPRHVLTARHVIYNQNRGEWASSVKVAAGYGDPQDRSPFGESHGTQGMILVEPFPGTWSFDIGVIELDRPIGALAGSVGIAAQDDWGSLICLGNRFFEEGQFYFGGYPGQSFDGNSMRVWSGNFDYVSWHQLLFDNEAGPEPGDSGSCTFTFVENQPYIVAVHNGETPLISLCSLTITQASIQSRFDLFKLAHVAQFAEKSLTDASDLVPLDVRVGTGNNPKHQAPVLYPGEPIEGLNVKIHNYSATDWSGDLKYEVYLSTDAELDPTNDRLLGEGQGARSIPSLGTGVLTTSQHFLPIDVGGEHPGNLYYLGIRLITADSNTENNQTEQWDMMPIRVPRAKTLLNLVSEVTGKEKETISIPVTLLGSRYYKPIAGQTVQFFLDDQILGDGVTDEQGKAVLTYKLPKKSAGIKTLKVKYLGASAYEPAEASARLTIGS